MISEYTFLKGKPYKKSLLDTAKWMVEGKEEQSISLREAKSLFIDALDNGFITNIERQTLAYLLEIYTFEEDAKNWLSLKVAQETPTQRAIQRTLWEANELFGIRWMIGDQEVAKQEKESKINFLTALYEMAHSFLYQMESSTSPRDILSLELGVDLENNPATTAALAQAMCKGSIYLFPENYLALIETGSLPFKEPDFTHEFSTHWTFGMLLPDLPAWYFIGFVNRKDSYDTYNTGYQ
ncbi:MAG: hypothetical protein HC892_00970 [Saprospiraceae bacterium]|nr:hypothetical protein [Saprospiraceae bacterium]